jgi:predicted MFS family arabinose efflux permease
VRAVAFTEICSIPFIYGIAFSPNLGLAAFSYLARRALMNMAGPVRTNFAMEVVQTEERATTSGLTIMADGIPRAISASIAGQFMRGGNYVLPYIMTSVIYFFASTLFLLFFRKTEKQQPIES